MATGRPWPSRSWPAGHANERIGHPAAVRNTAQTAPGHEMQETPLKRVLSGRPRVLVGDEERDDHYLGPAGAHVVATEALLAL